MDHLPNEAGKQGRGIASTIEATQISEEVCSFEKSPLTSNMAHVKTGDDALLVVKMISPVLRQVFTKCDGGI
jgi:hypothetical protein